jgi:hypothetical protein
MQILREVNDSISSTVLGCQYRCRWSKPDFEIFHWKPELLHATSRHSHDGVQNWQSCSNSFQPSPCISTSKDEYSKFCHKFWNINHLWSVYSEVNQVELLGREQSLKSPNGKLIFRFPSPFYQAKLQTRSRSLQEKNSARSHANEVVYKRMRKREKSRMFWLRLWGCENDRENDCLRGTVLEGAAVVVLI